MADRPTREFGKRRPLPPKPAEPPAKRSSHVALLLMGTFAVGGAASALMPRQSCTPAPPPAGMAAPPSPGAGVPAAPQPSGADCTSRGGYSGYHSSRYGFFGGGYSSSHSSSTSSSSEATSSGVTRGGFGSFAHAFGFSGG